VARFDGPDDAKLPFIDFSSGYVRRAVDALPKQGHQEPWRVNQNYLLDIKTLRYGELEDGTMEFR
jgi:hypothetical protein